MGVVKFKPWALYHRDRTPVRIKQEAGWKPEPVWDVFREDKVSRPLTGIRTPDRPTCSATLYSLRYAATRSWTDQTSNCSVNTTYFCQTTRSNISEGTNLDRRKNTWHQNRGCKLPRRCTGKIKMFQTHPQTWKTVFLKLALSARQSEAMNQIGEPLNEISSQFREIEERPTDVEGSCESTE